jgi:two-component system sensor histidine kinase/response regulator
MTSTTTPALPVLDPHRIAELRVLVERAGRGGEDLGARLTHLFTSGARDQRCQIEAARSAGDREGIIRSAHKLWGAAVNIGATRVAALARALEVDPAGCDGVALDALGAAVDAAEAALQAVLATPR